MLPEGNRLRSKYDFRRVKRVGRSAHSPYFTLLYAPAKDSATLRFGFVASTKFDKRAVVRNRARRLLREAVRVHLSRIKPGHDLVLIARKGVKEVSSAEVSASLNQILSKVSLLGPRSAQEALSD